MTTNNPHKIRLTSFNLNSINNIQRNQSKQARFRNPQIRCQFQTLEITIKKPLSYKPKIKPNINLLKKLESRRGINLKSFL